MAVAAVAAAAVAAVVVMGAGVMKNEDNEMMRCSCYGEETAVRMAETVSYVNR